MIGKLDGLCTVSFSVHTVSCLKTNLGTLKLLLCTVVNNVAISVHLELAMYYMGPLPN